jgi:hypothetical protein
MYDACSTTKSARNSSRDKLVEAMAMMYDKTCNYEIMKCYFGQSLALTLLYSTHSTPNFLKYTIFLAPMEFSSGVFEIPTSYFEKMTES